jgi:hypothetical protein
MFLHYAGNGTSTPFEITDEPHAVRACQEARSPAPGEIAHYAAMFDHLHHEALHGHQARQLIAAILAGL